MDRKSAGSTLFIFSVVLAVSITLRPILIIALPSAEQPKEEKKDRLSQRENHQKQSNPNQAKIHSVAESAVSSPAPAKAVDIQNKPETNFQQSINCAAYGTLTDWLMIIVTGTLAYFAWLNLIEMRKQIGVSEASSRAAETSAKTAQDALTSSSDFSKNVLKQMEAQSAAMQILAKATKDSAETSQKMFLMQRAHVRITGPDIDKEGISINTFFDVRLMIINAGATTADIIERNWRCLVAAKLPDVRPQFERTPERDIGLLYVNSPMQWKCASNVIASPEDFKSFRDGQFYIWVYGYVKYTTLSQSHETGFCYRYAWSGEVSQNYQSAYSYSNGGQPNSQPQS
jgi:hypothetical protein